MYKKFLNGSFKTDKSLSQCDKTITIIRNINSVSKKAPNPAQLSFTSVNVLNELFMAQLIQSETSTVSRGSFKVWWKV